MCLHAGKDSRQLASALRHESSQDHQQSCTSWQAQSTWQFLASGCWTAMAQRALVVLTCALTVLHQHVKI